MFLNTTNLQTTIINRDKELSHNLTIYYGTDIDNAVLLTHNDTDSTTPLTRAISVNAYKSLAFLDNYQITDELFKTTVILDNLPDQSQQYFISFDDGTSLNPVQLIKYEMHSLGKFYWLFFKKL